MVVLDFSYDYDLTMRIPCVIEVPNTGSLTPLPENVCPEYRERVKKASARVGSLDTGISSEYEKWVKNAIAEQNKGDLYSYLQDHPCPHGNRRPTIYLNLGIDSSKKPSMGYDLLLIWIKERKEWIGIEESSHLEGLTFGDYKDYEGPYALDEICALKILKVYGIPEGTLSPEKVIHTDPSKLEKIASEKK